MYMSEYVHVCMGEHGLTLGYISFSLYSFEARSLLEPGACVFLAILKASKLQMILLSLSPLGLGLQVCTGYHLSCWMQSPFPSLNPPVYECLCPRQQRSPEGMSEVNRLITMPGKYTVLSKPGCVNVLPMV